MFYACLTILILFVIMCFCVILAIIDLEQYNFGLYIVLLCIVGTMLACALCIANPNACANPEWYSKFCILLQELYPVPEDDTGRSSPKMNGLRSRMAAMQAQSVAANDETRLPLRQESRATVAMLAPAVHIMHQVWKGMAWVADGIDEDDERTRSIDVGETCHSTSDTGSETPNPNLKKHLSTIVETSTHEQVRLQFLTSSLHYLLKSLV
ncbi:unnamed protein product [Anisakis simplex]|uniref:Protein tweety homolog n=1 Tax=Anisakis simplex TaxID=6269 RepID=A0A0M3K3N3_ANISI|nr:unnamed protein product [Anisakis simplex]